ncbi:decapping mRNA 1 [Rhynchophorus ferrugineus]|uniref:mRNA-decapping enzyme C-terminal domain-containing protein n=1 Tax=Rhynchophorus ferrugineus TaxID=354439 RepID=A0A834HVP7_RHYFE|nr:hypothetical protein GWI33_017324 [Rhynchophorus ferrugineus]
MADLAEMRASINSIKRVDPYVKDILLTATQAALYEFIISKSRWVKTDKEGALFLYSRNGEPYHSIMILNRLNKENFIEPIIRDFDYQMQLPFLLYRNYKSRIYGIWFFNRDDCIQATELIKSLMEKDSLEERFSRGLDRRQNGGNDIFSMLSKAQEDFNRTPTKQESIPPAFSSTPRVPDGTSKSVMDFFAKASSSNNTQKTPASGDHVLHRLMSNPVHSVEHIEKQQRCITPQDQVTFRSETGGPDRRSVPINLPGTSGVHRKMDTFEANGIGMSSVSPPKPSMATSPLAYLMHPQSLTANDESMGEALGSSSFAQLLENAQKPLLMTPMMFTAPNTSAATASAPNGTAAEKSNEPQTEPLEMLTEKQLAQALIHLLKNNKEFIRQIHQAYTNSILEKVDKPKDGAV